LLRHWHLVLHDGLGQIRSGFVVVVAVPRVFHSRAWRNRFCFSVVVVLAAGQVSHSCVGRDLFGSGFHAAAFAVLEIH
jgi:hypothetical protein